MSQLDPIGRFEAVKGLRLGIMGGSFDPIHIGHLVTASEALERFGLQEILFMPTGTAPHKAAQTAPADLRYLFAAVATADAVLDILTWKEPDRVLELATVIAATRPGYELDRLSTVLAGLERRDRVHVMEIPALAVSSSLIRERLARGRSVRYLVPEGVVELLDKSGVYGRTLETRAEPTHG
jgi:nicotinate-nucleotide adenylyltransferase